ncbi:hypothetical protein [Nonomuraea cavernae]|uniref:Uncharacterized protein n=1 Tax=Nonomuraea cavernae TaxID=2045107 RepID=A0A917YPF3_9ACTN|nr:hypothetical protein [Nonomuraea cavernae]MCA2184660.1 hypothetical protein [Nonomuraea cavernae]GGO63144.1 hypothetical protein GCM10012289_09390 [Nonomuraea cavernae]
MYWHTSDNAEQEGRQPGRLADRSFWLNDAPRLMLWCRLLGHKPVVDGYGPAGATLRAARWVTCDRCGVRPDPQGNLDPDEWPVGVPYDGPWIPLTRVLAMSGAMSLLDLKRPPIHASDLGKPGPFPDKPTGTIGGQLLLGRTFGGFSAEVKVGNAGSEHTLAAHLRIHPLGALYLHTERFGTWLQRRLNPTGYDSRVISLSFDDWAIRTQLWARRGCWSRDDPWWMHGRVSLDLVEKVLGHKRFSYRTVDGPVMGWIKMPEGDSHQVQLTLKRVRLGRSRAEWAAKYHWSVEWESATPIVTRPGKGGTVSASVQVPDQAVEARCWDVLACAVAAKQLSERRAEYGYQPEAAE